MFKEIRIIPLIGMPLFFLITQNYILNFKKTQTRASPSKLDFKIKKTVWHLPDSLKKPIKVEILIDTSQMIRQPGDHSNLYLRPIALRRQLSLGLPFSNYNIYAI